MQLVAYGAQDIYLGQRQGNFQMGLEYILLLLIQRNTNLRGHVISLVSIVPKQQVVHQIVLLQEYMQLTTMSSVLFQGEEISHIQIKVKIESIFNLRIFLKFFSKYKV